MCRCHIFFTFIGFLIISSKAQIELTKVVGGTPTNIQKFPIIVQLLLDSWGNKQYTQHCAGVIITSHHVISTAHCYQNNVDTGRNYSLPSFWSIRAGSSYRSQGGTITKVKKIITHPNFNKFYHINDIAIIVAAKNFVIGNSARQATIPIFASEIKPNSLCTLVGWGATEIDGPQPEQLQFAILYTMDQQTCQMRYDNIGAVISDTMICATKKEGSTVIDGCYGDSGGPLMYKGVVVGLVSFGYACGHNYYPGVYTKLSHFTKWIVATVSANNK